MEPLVIKKVTIVCQAYGSDDIHITIAGESPFPELNEKFPGEYEPVVLVSCRKGYAEQWCNLMGIKVDNIVHAGAGISGKHTS
jgi:hypothetical protein